jgi:hypothetical protein
MNEQAGGTDAKQLGPLPSPNVHSFVISREALHDASTALPHHLHMTVSRCAFVGSHAKRLEAEAASSGNESVADALRAEATRFEDVIRDAMRLAGAYQIFTNAKIGQPAIFAFLEGKTDELLGETDEVSLFLRQTRANHVSTPAAMARLFPSGDEPFLEFVRSRPQFPSRLQRADALRTVHDMFRPIVSAYELVGDFARSATETEPRVRELLRHSIANRLSSSVAARHSVMGTLSLNKVSDLRRAMDEVGDGADKLQRQFAVNVFDAVRLVQKKCLRGLGDALRTSFPDYRFQDSWVKQQRLAFAFWQVVIHPDNQPLFENPSDAAHDELVAQTYVLASQYGVGILNPRSTRWRREFLGGPTAYDLAASRVPNGRLPENTPQLATELRPDSHSTL